MKTLFALSLAAVGLATTGCSQPMPPQGVDGFELSAKWWAKDSRTVLSRASFDLGCAPDQIQLVVVATYPNGYNDVAQAIGVRGCDKRATYVRSQPYSAWIMNAETEETATSASGVSRRAR